MGDMKEVP